MYITLIEQSVNKNNDLIKIFCEKDPVIPFLYYI